jgi:anaerobic selenocysteine-containing dehydrogenase
LRDCDLCKATAILPAKITSNLIRSDCRGVSAPQRPPLTAALLEIHPTTAIAQDVNDGDWLILEFVLGKVTLKAQFNDALHQIMVAPSTVAGKPAKTKNSAVTTPSTRWNKHKSLDLEQ